MTICSGPVTQIAWVSADIDATEHYLTQTMGAGRWTRLPDIHFGPDSWLLHDRPADFTVHVSLTYLGDMQLEVIQPVRGESIYAEFLTATGGGLHHLCVDTDDMDATLADASAAGVAVVQQGSMVGGANRFAYLDGSAAGAPYLEIAQLSSDMRAFYDQVKAQATA